MTRVAIMGIIVEDTDSAEAINALLHAYGQHIVGRMGIPYRERGINLPAGQAAGAVIGLGASMIARRPPVRGGLRRLPVPALPVPSRLMAVPTMASAVLIPYRLRRRRGVSRRCSYMKAGFHTGRDAGWDVMMTP